MIKHIVLWKLKDYVQGKTKQENAYLIKTLLEDLNNRIPGLLKLEVGIDFSNTENSADVVLYSEFESKTDLENYQTHSEHEKIKPFVAQCRLERRVIDFEI
jgi:heme-degrading monooxygenase HmoA